MNYIDIESLFEQLDKTLLFNTFSFLLLYFFAPKVAVKAFKMIEKNFMPFLRAILITIILNNFLKLLFEYLKN